MQNAQRSGAAEAAEAHRRQYASAAPAAFARHSSTVTRAGGTPRDVLAAAVTSARREKEERLRAADEAAVASEAAALDEEISANQAVKKWLRAQQKQREAAARVAEDRDRLGAWGRRETDVTAPRYDSDGGGGGGGWPPRRAVKGFRDGYLSGPEAAPRAQHGWRMTSVTRPGALAAPRDVDPIFSRPRPEAPPPRRRRPASAAAALSPAAAVTAVADALEDGNAVRKAYADAYAAAAFVPSSTGLGGVEGALIHDMAAKESLAHREAQRRGLQPAPDMRFVDGHRMAFAHRGRGGQHGSATVRFQPGTASPRQRGGSAFADVATAAMAVAEADPAYFDVERGGGYTATGYGGYSDRGGDSPGGSRGGGRLDAPSRWRAAASAAVASSREAARREDLAYRRVALERELEDAVIASAARDEAQQALLARHRAGDYGDEQRAGDTRRVLPLARPLSAPPMRWRAPDHKHRSTDVSKAPVGSAAPIRAFHAHGCSCERSLLCLPSFCEPPLVGYPLLPVRRTTHRARRAPFAGTPPRLPLPRDLRLRGETPLPSGRDGSARCWCIILTLSPPPLILDHEKKSPPPPRQRGPVGRQTELERRAEARRGRRKRRAAAWRQAARCPMERR